LVLMSARASASVQAFDCVRLSEGLVLPVRQAERGNTVLSLKPVFLLSCNMPSVVSSVWGLEFRHGRPRLGSDERQGQYTGLGL